MGQVGSDLGNSNVVNPKQAQWGDLDNSEKSARMIGGAAQGLNKGMQAYNSQTPQGGGGPQINPMQFAQQPQVDPSMFAPRKPGNNLAFYGGGQ